MVYVEAPVLEHETLFCLDRSLRSVVSQNPYAEWSEMLAGLELDGFRAVLHPRDNPVFVHSRPWDEHLLGYGLSFFVSFPENAPFELAGQLVLAATCPMLYACISSDYSGPGSVVLINSVHDPIYPDDQVWRDPEQKEKCTIGPVFLVQEQFCSVDEYSLAKRSLLGSGYILAEGDE